MIISILKKIFSFIFALYAMVIFALSGITTVLAFYPVLWIAGKNWHKRGHQLIRLWGRVLMFFLFMPVKVKGKEKLNPSETYVFISNHISQVDIPVSFLSTSHTFKMLGKKEALKIPFVGQVVRKLYVLVDRSSPESRKKSRRLMREEIENGMSMYLYPEGTRNRGPALTKKFYDGAFRLAIETQKPIAVLTILDTFNRQSANEKVTMLPGRIRTIWDDPIETKGMTDEDIPRLIEKCTSIIEGHLAGCYGSSLY